MPADQIIEIIKKRDEYPISIEISDDNAKGEPRITINARFESDKMDEAELKAKMEICRKVWKQESDLLSGKS